jgi:hypothetical protein
VPFLFFGVILIFVHFLFSMLCYVDIGDALLSPVAHNVTMYQYDRQVLGLFLHVFLVHLNGQVSQEGMGVVGMASGCSRYRAPYCWLNLTSPHLPTLHKHCSRQRRHGFELREEDTTPPVSTFPCIAAFH